MPGRSAGSREAQAAEGSLGDAWKLGHGEPLIAGVQQEASDADPPGIRARWEWRFIKEGAASEGGTRTIFRQQRTRERFFSGPGTRDVETSLLGPLRAPSGCPRVETRVVHPFADGQGSHKRIARRGFADGKAPPLSGVQAIRTNERCAAATTTITGRCALSPFLLGGFRCEQRRVAAGIRLWGFSRRCENRGHNPADATHEDPQSMPIGSAL